jgi:hypothetical protein
MWPPPTAPQSSKSDLAARIATIWVPILALVGSAIGAVGAVLVYSSTQLVAARKPYLEKQLEVYDSAMRLAAELYAAPSAKGEKWGQNLQEFKSILFIKARALADEEVLDNMQKVNNIFDELAPLNDNDFNKNKLNGELPRASANLATSIKTSIRKNWSPQLWPF